MTNWPRTIAKRVAYAAATLGCWLVLASAALAQQTNATEVTQKNYAANWLLVSLAIVMGLLTVCRPARRADKPKQPEATLHET